MIDVPSQEGMPSAANSLTVVLFRVKYNSQNEVQERTAPFDTCDHESRFRGILPQ